MRPFHLEQLRTFVAVCEAGSLAAGAPQVFLSQSAVSEQLRKLEQHADQALRDHADDDADHRAGGDHGQRGHGAPLEVEAHGLAVVRADVLPAVDVTRAAAAGPAARQAIVESWRVEVEPEAGVPLVPELPARLLTPIPPTTLAAVVA